MGVDRKSSAHSQNGAKDLEQRRTWNRDGRPSLPIINFFECEQ